MALPKGNIFLASRKTGDFPLTIIVALSICFSFPPGELSITNRQDEIERKKNQILMLKSCLSMKRLKLSVAINDIKNYCFEHVDSDQLINASKDDPFKNKKKCSIF